ncbi:unnamed protein product [Urochloa decumbens]|uniref:Uncharacterized protein n=1 Tax=Urochloa decumbens TaxID=240449 RepID=A0ABC9H071_9POAL
MTNLRKYADKHDDDDDYNDDVIEWNCTTCGATRKIVHQVTTCSPGLQTASLSGGDPHPPRNHQDQDTFALADDSTINTRQAITADPPEAQFWFSDYNVNLIMQQLKELESLSDEVVALQLQLVEYKEEIEKSKRNSNAGRNWFVPLPDNVKNVLVKARDVLNSLIAISTPPKN